MAITTGTVSILDKDSATVIVKTLNDSVDSSKSPAHAILDGTTGALVSPATSAAQTTAQTSLTTIATNTTASTVHLTAAPTNVAGAYTTGMVVGGKLSLSGAARVNAGGGIIQSALIGVKTALTAPYDILIFDTDPSNSTFTDNAALAVNVADLPSLVGVIQCTTLISLGTPQALQALNCALPFKLSAAATTLYAVIVIRGAQTFASTTATVLDLVVIQD